MTVSGDFGVVSHLLAAARKHSTSVGKVWVSVLFVFRIFVLITATKEVWQDEQSNFLCDTNQPGCQLGCYDKTFPFSHVRFWVMQIIFVSTPTLVYLGFVVHKTRTDKKKETNATKDKDDQTSNKDSNNEPEVPLEGPVWKMYIVNVVSKILLEIAFFVAQYYLYGFGLESMYTCEQWPCLTKVFCYVSRPTEKTIFIIFMLLVALLSLLLNVLELGYIFWKKKKKDSECDSVQSNFECKSVQCSIDRNSSEIDSLDPKSSEIDSLNTKSSKNDLLKLKLSNSTKQSYV
ncbi:gap junction alpha-3 protein-like [Poecilia formosa]|uniref:gap junction alpha-3 protein-like n=1 Tax=Poecilia formosa TaxID=48698 RepID=UPI000443F0F9|nr:PREDICTED: gap junction alpha-3 protein-like [Poecilia formosa]XP_007546040.1 PREDICTED: gap junction alpha-3 protein-like [Poecilia formosa]